MISAPATEKVFSMEVNFASELGIGKPGFSKMLSLVYFTPKCLR